MDGYGQSRRTDPNLFFSSPFAAQVSFSGFGTDCNDANLIAHKTFTLLQIGGGGNFRFVFAYCYDSACWADEGLGASFACHLTLLSNAGYAAIAPYMMQTAAATPGR